MNTVIGIRKEDISRWERRVPLIPAHAGELAGIYPIDILVQSSEIRIFEDGDYRKEGLRIVDTLSPCSVVFAIKEIPLERLEKDKIYVFFSHTAKGQPKNMPMLRKMMELGCSLIDYEKMVDAKGRRVLFFGNYAGHAGMTETLWALGKKLASEGIDSPFATLDRAHRYGGLVELKAAVRGLADRIAENGLPPDVTPLVFGFLGYGHVSQGAQEIFDILPFEEVTPARIPGLFGRKTDASRVVYKTVFREEDMVEPREPGKAFDLQDYYQNPGGYRPVVESLVPYLTVVINGIFWTPKYPRFITKAFLQTLFGGADRPRLRVIGDITCDIDGSIESTVRATDIENPVFTYDPQADRALTGFEGPGPAVLAVYNLPAELPLESSTYFSRGLKDLVPAIAQGDFKGDFSGCGLPDVVRKAVILYRGALTPDYAYLEEHVRG